MVSIIIKIPVYTYSYIFYNRTLCKLHINNNLNDLMMAFFAGKIIYRTEH